ncbi:MAG: hypothetical protein ACRC6T_11170 [Sarcina sp.]
MKKKLILVLVASLLGISILGCSNVKAEIVVKEDVTTEDVKKEKKLVYEKIDNPENYQFDNIVGIDGNFYSTSGQGGNRVFYKLSKDNKLEEIKSNEVIKEEKGLGQNLRTERSHNELTNKTVERIEYYDKFSDTPTKTYPLIGGYKKGNDLMDSVNMISEEHGFHSITKVDENGNSNELISLEIINVKTDEIIDVNIGNEIEGQVVEGIYAGGFYLITDRLEVVELKNEGNNLVIDKVIELKKEFDLNEKNRLSIEKDGTEFIIFGAKNVESIEDSDKNELIDVEESFIIKYDVETKEKKYINGGKDKVILDYKNDIIRFYNHAQESSNLEFARYYLGEVVEDNIKTIGEIDFEGNVEEGPDEKMISFTIDPNEDASEYLVCIQKEHGLEKDQMDRDLTYELLRIKIE